MGALARFLSWSLQKLTFGLLLLALGLTGFGLWLFLRDNVDFDLRRQDLIRALTGENRKLREALKDVQVRIDGMTADATRNEQRAAEAARLANELDALNSGLNRLTTSGDQVKLNDERLARLRLTEKESRAQVAALREALKRAQWEKDGLEIALGKLDVQIQAAERQKSKIMHYALAAWEKFGRRVLIAVAVWFLAPPLGRMVAFFVVAPFISSRAPVRLGTPAPVDVTVRGSDASVDVVLEPGDVLWVKEKFLQASDEGLLKRTRWLLDWSMPLTCLAAGLKELIEMRNAAPEAKLRATFSSQDDAHVELAVVTVPAGASLVLRPSYLAGLIGPLGRKATAIRRHWRLFALQSWATGQFRYFEFVGPCTLLLAGSRGVRAEVLAAQPGLPVPGRRANQDATIGFTPGLAYRPVRAETFWAYFRGQNPLFDDLFEGTGVFLCQQTSAKGEAAEQRKWMASLRDGLLRVFGL
ncbi:MAG: hypothetical protein HYV96_21370 [Opitutae bacterium]|nr:hypothetical protein [Opitutae bacterium]